MDKFRNNLTLIRLAQLLMGILSMYLFNRGHDIALHKMAKCLAYKTSQPFLHAEAGSKLIRDMLKACSGKFFIPGVYFGLGAGALSAREVFRLLESQQSSKVSSETENRRRLLIIELSVFMLCTLDENEWLDWDYALWYVVAGS